MNEQPHIELVTDNLDKQFDEIIVKLPTIETFLMRGRWPFIEWTFFLAYLQQNFDLFFGGGSVDSDATTVATATPKFLQTDDGRDQ